MSFDAGSITAELSIGTARADADLKRIEDRVKALESGRHEVKISAVFDDASIGRAKAMFAALDNSISRDAMQRLRSSPQGSVLGALNALFSPHPVTGAPSPQQAASQGLLGKMFAPQGGGSTPVAGGGSSTVRDVLTGQNAPQRVTVTDQGGAAGAGDLKDAAQAEKEAAAETRAAADDAKDAAGRAKSAASDTSSAARDLSGASSGIRGVLGGLKGLFGGGSGGGSGGAAGAFGKGLAGGIGPGIAGVGVKPGLITAGIGSALATLPALAGIIGTGMGVAMVGGLVAVAAKESPRIKAQFTAIGTDLKTVLTQASAPLIPALSGVLKQVPGLVKSLEPQLAGIFKVVAPQLQSVYAGLVPIVHGLVGLAQAAAPAFGPFITAIEKLVSSLLPGIAVVVRATVPVLSQFGQIMGTLGKNLGGFFAAAAPAVKASMTVLGALLGVVGSLLPVIVKLGGVFATALAPVIVQLAGAIKALTPFFTVLGKIFAQLASALLGDLVSAFTALAGLLKDVAPSFTQFATALSGVFTLLENSGVFATLGDALENLTPPLAKMIDALLNGLTPLIPPVLQFFTQLSNIMIGAFSSALTQVIPPLTQLATTVLQALAASLPVVLPVLAKVFGVFTVATADAIAAIVKALAGIVNAIPKPVLDTLAGLAATLLILKKTGVISLGFKLAGAAQKLFSLLTGGGTVDVASAGMQKAGDTMAEAAAGMQKAADTMTGAATGEEAAGAEQDTAGTEEIAAGGLMATGLGSALTAALPALGALTLALVAYEGLKSGANILNYFKNPAGAAQALTPGGTPPGAFTTTVPQPVVNAANKQNAAALASQYPGDIAETSALLAGGKAVQAILPAFQALNDTFTLQSQSAGAAKSDLDAYTKSVQASGTASQASKQAADQLITDLEDAGVTSGTAQADVADYTAAIAQNGISSSQAQAARAQLITDILNAGTNAQQGQSALQNYTAAVQDDGARSQAAQGARAQLIKDLENAGASAQGAQQLVDELTTAIKGLPSSKTVKITMDGSGLYTITGPAVAKSQGPGGSGNAAGGLATGGPITQGTTGTADDVNINVSRGEYVVKASSVAKYGTGMMDAINAGAFASGGMVGGNLTPGFVSGMYDDFQNQMTTAMVTAMRTAIKAATAAAAAAAATAGASGGKTTGGGMSPSAIAALWTSLGGPASAAANMARIAYAESGDDPSIVQKGEPPGLTGWGLYQITPTSGITQNGQFGNLLNASNNTKAAIYLFRSDGYSPWSSDPVGAGLSPRAAGGGLISALLGGWMPGQGGQGGWGGLQGLAGMMSGASGGGTNPLAGTAFVGNYTGVVSPASGGFGITAQQLGLPPPASTSTSASSPADTSASGTGTSTTPATPAAVAAAKPAALDAAQKAAIAVLESLLAGYIKDNKLGQANQANVLLRSLGVSKYNSQLSEIASLDGLLKKYQAAKNKAAVTATEHLLESYGVHSFSPVLTATGNAPKSAVITRITSLLKSDITNNSRTAMDQANTLLGSLGVSKYNSQIQQIRNLDNLLAGYKKKKDTRDISATEVLLRQLGVRHFAQGGTLWEPVIGFGQQSGGVYQFAEHGPETVTPGAQGGTGDMVTELRMLRGQMDKLISTTASVPHGVTSGIGSALGGAAQSASFSRRYHNQGY